MAGWQYTTHITTLHAHIASTPVCVVFPHKPAFTHTVSKHVTSPPARRIVLERLVRGMCLCYVRCERCHETAELTRRHAPSCGA